MSNLKGSKKKPSDLLTFAKATRILLKNKGRWGIKEMSDYFGTSQYMIRQIDKINELDKELQRLVTENNLGIEAAYHLWRIQQSKDRGLKNAKKAFDVIKNMKSAEVRTFTHFFLKNPDLSLEQCKELSDKVHPEEIKILVLPLNEITFEKLLKESKKANLKINEYAIRKLER